MNVVALTQEVNVLGQSYRRCQICQPLRPIEQGRVRIHVSFGTKYIDNETYDVMML